MRLARKHNDDLYWSRGIELSKNVIKLVTESKREYVNEQLDRNKNCSKKFWNSVKLVLPDNKCSNIDVVWHPELEEYVSGTDAANLVNEFFSNIGKKLADKIGCPDTEYYPPDFGQNFVWGGFITVPEVLRLINQLSKHNSSGIPDLSSRILIDC